MKKNYLLLSILLVWGLHAYSQSLPPMHSGDLFTTANGEQKYYMYYQDNFSTFNSSLWDIQSCGDAYGSWACSKSSNAGINGNGELELKLVKEAQLYIPDPNDPQFYYATKYRNNEIPGYQFTSANVASKNEYRLKYGYIEMRVKGFWAPNSHNGFWVYRTDYFNNTGYTQYENEIDFEIFGQKTIFNLLTPLKRLPDKQVHTNHHHVQGDNPDAEPVVGNDATQWHIYGILITPDYVAWYIDGLRVRYEENDKIHQGVNLIFNTQMGEPTNEILEKWDLSYEMVQRLKIDWVKVYHQGVTNFVAPYISEATDDDAHPGQKKVTLKWRMPHNYNEHASCMLEWGASTLYGENTPIMMNTKEGRIFSTTIDNLDPGATVYYKLSVNEKLHPQMGSSMKYYTGSFNAPIPNGAATCTFYATGAGHSTSATNFFNPVLGLIDNEIAVPGARKTFLLHTGNRVASDNHINWTNGYFGQSNSFALSLLSKIPVVGPAGVNEKKLYAIDNAMNPTQLLPHTGGRNYFDFYNYDYTDIASFIDPDPANWNYHYKYEYGPVHISFADVDAQGCGIDLSLNHIGVFLSTTSKAWKVISLHYPMKSLMSDPLNQTAYNKIKDFARTYGVQLVILGHENYYAHWVDDGVHYMVLGNGGTGYIDDQMIQSEKEVFASTVPHYAKFRISGDMMYVDVIQGADYNNTLGRRVMERFAVPRSKNEILANTTWQSEPAYPIVMDNIIVHPGAVLDLQSELRMTEDGVVKLLAGATLKMENPAAKITGQKAYSEEINFVSRDAQGTVINTYTSLYAEEDRFWKGVVVRSNPFEEQQFNATTSNSNQGVVIMRNGATIENARCGIEATTLVNTIDNYMGGGIIILENAHIKNCITGVRMQPYTYTNNLGKTARDKSSFTNVNFENNNNWISPLEKPDAHVHLLGVNNVTFSACGFYNNISSLPPTERGTGIRLSDASINLHSVCTSATQPCSAWQHTHFQNLYYGVRGSLLDAGKQVAISQAVFENVYHGIHLINSDDAKITQNTFQIAEAYNNSGGDLSYGVYIDGGSGFRIEENSLTSYGAYAGTIGIILNGTGAANNEVYKNTFNNLNVGIQPQYINKDNSATSQGDGLKLLCNVNNNPGAYDFWISSQDMFGNVVVGGGIAEAQQVATGNPSTPYLPAGNQFTISNRTADQDFSNARADLIYYSYDNNNPPYKALPVYYSNVQNKPRHAGNQCPTKIANNNNSLSQLYTTLSSAMANLNSSKLIYYIWANGGNANLGQQVATVLPWESYDHFNALMSESPYLTAEVLTHVVQNSSFTDLMVKLLFIANPHSVRDRELINALLEARPAFPETYLDEMMDEEQTVSQLDLLNNDVAADRHYLDQVSNRIIAYYRQDTLHAWAADSLLAFCQRQPKLEALYQLAGMHQHDGRFADANNLLAEVTSRFDLKEREYEDYNNYLSLFEISETMYQSPVFSGSLTEAQCNTLQALAVSHRPGLSQKALAMLVCNNPAYDYQEEILLAATSSGRRTTEASGKANIPVGESFTVFPNPAFDFVTLRLQLDASYSQVVVEAYDPSGRKVFAQAIEQGQEEILLGLDMLSKGTYMLKLVADHKVLGVKEIVIVK